MGDVPVAVEAKEAQQAVDAVRRWAWRGRFAQLAHHDQVFEAAQMRVEMRLFGHVAHALLVGDRVALDGLAVEQDLAGGGLDQAGDHLHGGGFAGAVRSQVAGDLAGARREADVVDGGDAEEAFETLRSSSMAATLCSKLLSCIVK